MRGAEETLVDLYVGESVFERMLFFVIEKSVPNPPPILICIPGAVPE